MAKQTITTILDDIDGSDAEETVTFALDGIGYEIDLNAKHAGELREFLSKYMDAGTRIGRVEGRNAQLTRHVPSVYRPQTAESREWNQKVRAWAVNNGWELSDRGRIPQHVIDAFEAKAPNPTWLAQREAARKVEEEVGYARTAKPRKRAGTAATFSE